MKRIISIFAALLCLCTVLLSMQMTVAAPKSILLSQMRLKMSVGGTKILKLKGSAGEKVKWKSTNTKVASVKNGRIKGKSEGKCFVIASCRNKSYRCNVRVISKNKKDSDAANTSSTPMPSSMANSEQSGSAITPNPTKTQNPIPKQVPSSTLTPNPTTEPTTEPTAAPKSKILKPGQTDVVTSSADTIEFSVIGYDDENMELTFRIVNHLDRDIFLGPEDISIEKYIDGAWYVVPMYDSGFIDEALIWDAKEEGTFSQTIYKWYDDLSPGRYRAIKGIVINDFGETPFAAEFQVE